jgi:PAS domain S-box-containing protein
MAPNGGGNVATRLAETAPEIATFPFDRIIIGTSIPREHGMNEGSPESAASPSDASKLSQNGSGAGGPCPDLLRMVIDHVPAFVALTDAEGRYVVANQMYVDAFGKCLDEIVGHPWREVFPELIPHHGGLIERAMAGETVVFDDVLDFDPTRPTHVHGHYRPLFDEAGRVRYISALVMDVTELVGAQEALKKSEERLRLVNEAINEAIGIRDGRTYEVHFMNPTFEELYGLSRDELARDPLATVRAVHPEDRPAFIQWLKTIRDTGTGGEFEYRVLLPDGAVKWLWAGVQPVLAADGSVDLWVTTSRDITQRRVAEEALASEKKLLAATLSSIGDGVIATDRDGRVVLANPVAQAALGWSEEEILGRALGDVYRTGDSGAAHVAGSEAGGRGQRFLSTRQGDTVPISERRTPLRDARGDEIGDVVVFRDVTADLQREEELIKTQKLESLAVLAGGIAHDFNNLLTGIQGNLSLVLEGPGLSEGPQRWIEDAQAAADRARGLTNQLLTFARGGEPVRKVTDLRRTIREAAAFSRVGSSVSCRVDVAEGLWPVDADEGQIGQVVQNLVMNAIEATAGAGEVGVEATNVTLEEDNAIGLPQGPFVRIRVSDRGTGIPDEIAGRIFDPYFSTKQRRSGLGLAITHSIVARHGGRIALQSVHGQGTRFDVLLPALPARRVHAVASCRPDLCRCGRVLVMDDDPFVRTTVERLLASMGCNAMATGDGESAVTTFRAARERGEPFAVLLLDLTVPGGMGGVEALSAIRRIDPEVPAVVMSGYAEDPVMARHADYGFQAVLPKPFTLDGLGVALRDATSGGGQEP